MSCVVTEYLPWALCVCVCVCVHVCLRGAMCVSKLQVVCW